MNDKCTERIVKKKDEEMKISFARMRQDFYPLEILTGYLYLCG